MALLNDKNNRDDWAIIAPTFNITKLGAFFAAIITPAGGALAALVHSRQAMSDAIVISILAVVAVVLVSATVIAVTDIRARGMGARAGGRAARRGVVPLSQGFEVTVAGMGPKACRVLALREGPSGADDLEYLLVNGLAAPTWCPASRLTVVGPGSATSTVPPSEDGQERAMTWSGDLHR